MPTLEAEVFELARSDRARYLCALTAPLSKRQALLALLAFDQEIARIPGAVSEPMLGHIRLQWWLDALAADQLPAHPVALALAPLNLNMALLGALVQARLFELEQTPPTFDDLCRYAEATGGAYAGLLLDRLSVDHEGAQTAARDIGTAHVLAKFLSVKTAFSEEEVRAKIQDLLCRARAQNLPKAVKKAAFPALVLARLVDRQLHTGGAANAHTGAVLSVWWGQITGRY